MSHDQRVPKEINRSSQLQYQLFRKRNREFVDNIRNNTPCSICGESDPIVLQFHHKDPNSKWIGPKDNDKGVSGLSSRTVSVKTIAKEIEKCIMLCANCHLKVEAGKIDVSSVPVIKIDLER